MKDDESKLFRVVLIEPEIPQNTGNIGRTCVAANCELHLVGKMGFTITDAQLKRAGLDYWPHLKWFQHATWDDWFSKVESPERVFYFTTKTQQRYFDIKYQAGDWLVFGKETKGLDPSIINTRKAQCVTIPHLGPVRSLNLATSVAIAVYEGVRQLS